MRRAITGVAAALAGALVLSGAASGTDEQPVCTSTEGPVCIQIEDTDGVSLSNVLLVRYMAYTVSVRAPSESGVVTMKLIDIVNDREEATTAQWVREQLPEGCASTGTPGEIACQSDGSDTFGPMPVRTSLTASATATRLTVTAVFEEGEGEGEIGIQTHEPPPPPPEPTASEDTIYEADGNDSASIVFAGISIALNTKLDDVQSALFPVDTPDDFEGIESTSLQEFGPNEDGFFCPYGVSCFGQTVSTTGRRIFSPFNPAEVLAILKFSQLPPGKNPKNIVVYHRRDDEQIVQIRATCTGIIGKTPPPEQLPCRRIFVDPWKHVVVIDAWDVDQGDWGWS